MAALLALGRRARWGVGDFLGGLAARRLAVLTVLAVSQAVGLVGVLVWVVLSGDAFPGVGELLPAAGAGIAAMVGLGCALPRLRDRRDGDRRSDLGSVTDRAARGRRVAAETCRVRCSGSGSRWCSSGIVVLSREPTRGRTPRIAAGAGLAVVAALGFGLFFVGIDAGADESAAWAVDCSALRVGSASSLAAALITSTALRPPRALLPMLVGVGVFDTVANVSRRGRDDVRGASASSPC